MNEPAEPAGPEASDASDPAAGDGPRLPGWALATWPAAWRERYGDELSDTWADTGASRRAAVGIALRGLHERLARPLPAGLVTSPLGPAWDTRPSWRRRGVVAGVAATVFAAGNALALALLALSDAVGAPTPLELLLSPLVALAGLGVGLRIVARPGFRSIGHGLIVGVLAFALLPTLLIFPWPLLLGLVVVVGRRAVGARHGTRRARLAAVVAGVYALLVVASGGFLLGESLFHPEPSSFAGIWLLLATQPLSFIAMALPSMPPEAFVAVLLGCGAVQGAVLHRLVRGRR